MDNDRIRELISIGLNAAETGMLWIDELDDTDPAHYGLEDLDVGANKEHIFVDTPKRSFEFTDVPVSFSARLGGSSEANGIDQNFTVTLSGIGTYDFAANDKIVIKSIRISGHVSLYAE